MLEWHEARLEPDLGEKAQPISAPEQPFDVAVLFDVFIGMSAVEG